MPVPGKYVAPDITAVFGMYTANQSWATGAIRIGSFPKYGIKYRLGGVYGNVNLKFYRKILGVEKSFLLNMEAIPVFAQLSKQLGKTDWYLGARYLYLHNTISAAGNLPEFIKKHEIKTHTGTVGFFVELDKRNSIFTADKGYRLHIEDAINDQWTGSSFSYQIVSGSYIGFKPVTSKWIAGLRLEAQHAINDPPFYLLPGISMRGIPMARYQGQTTGIIETEQRYDFTMRWSGLVFGGVAKAIPQGETFSSSKTVYNAGVGFRYLIMRAFKMRAGIDIAVGPESFGYYIVFGHNWNR